MRFDPNAANRQKNPFENQNFNNPYRHSETPVNDVDENMLTNEDYIESLLKSKKQGGKR